MSLEYGAFQRRMKLDADVRMAMVQISGRADGDAEGGRGGGPKAQEIIDQGTTVNKPEILAVTTALKPACQRRVERGQRINVRHGHASAQHTSARPIRFPIRRYEMRFILLISATIVVLVSSFGCTNLKTESGVYAWAKRRGDICSWEYYMRHFPRGSRVEKARQRILEAQPTSDLWRSVAEGMIDLDDIDVVYFDPADGQLKFIGDHYGKLPPLVFDDLVECLQMLGQGHDIGVSIEPKAGIKTGQAKIGEPMRVRYIPEAIRNTHLGNTLYEIDRRLKTLSLGVDNLTHKTVSSNVPGFSNIPARVRASGFKGGSGHFGLLWFEPESPEVHADGYKLSFRRLKMKLIPEGQHESLRDFAEHFTGHFGAYAEESTVFAELRRIHKLVIIARWLRDVGLPLTRLEHYPRIRVKTPKKTGTVFAVYRTETWGGYPYAGGYMQYGLIGGINLSPPTRYYIPALPPTGSVVSPGTYVPPSSFVPVSWNNPLPQYSAMVNQKVVLPPDCRLASAARPSPAVYHWNATIGGKSKRVVAVPLTGGEYGAKNTPGTSKIARRQGVLPEEVIGLQIGGHWFVEFIVGERIDEFLEVAQIQCSSTEIPKRLRLRFTLATRSKRFQGGTG